MFKISNQDISIDDIVELEVATWPEGTRSERSVFEKRSKIFPEGFVSLREYDEDSESYKLVALSTSMIMDWNPSKQLMSWEDTTDYGTISNHNASGNTLYIVSVGVHPAHQRRGLGSRLIDLQKTVAKKLGLKYIVLGSRMPFYYLAEDSVTPEEHVLVDKEISFYLKNDFDVHSIVKNYMEDDHESRNYGVVMYYKCD